MKATELRIGNWVTIDNPEAWPELKGIPMVVVSIEKEEDEDFPSSSGAVRVIIGRQYYSQFDEFIQPIPLTEEWLLKFGFELYSENRCRNFMLPKNKFFISKWMEDEPGAGFEEKGAFYWSDRFSKIEFVHQLQNLYWCLCGEELTINE